MNAARSLLLLALLNSCEALDIESCDSAGGGAPYMPLDGTWQAPNAQGAINYSCEFDGVTNDPDYFAGLTVCEYEGEPRFYTAPTYFERQCGPYDCGES